MNLLRLIFQGVYAFPDAFEQAVAHFSHDAFGTALRGFVSAVAEVDGSSGDQLVGLVGEVTVSSTHACSQSTNAVERAGIGPGCCGAQQFFDFVAD